MSKAQLIYAGIGSRETPSDVLALMKMIAMTLATHGWLLRSGFAGGADKAFYDGCLKMGGSMINYLPWSSFNGAQLLEQKHFSTGKNLAAADFLAQQFHPAWHRCSPQAKLLHARNGYQVMGDNLQTPADMVVCWTKGALAGGGTGQAIRIANHYNIPVFDLAREGAFRDMVTFVDSKTP